MIDIFVIPELPQLLAQWGATLILFLIVRKFVYAPMKEFLEKRQNTIATDLETAKAKRLEAETLKANYEKDLKNAKEEGNRIIEESRNRGKELERQLKEDGKAQAEQILDKARLQIAKEKEMAYREVKDSTSDMAVAIAEKIIGESLSNQGQQALVDDFLKKLETKNV